jgi:hypothetical protein
MAKVIFGNHSSVLCRTPWLSGYTPPTLVLRNLTVAEAAGANGSEGSAPGNG